MQPLPSYDSQFITLFESGDGYVRRHVAVDVIASDYSYLEEIAMEKAMMGMKVDMMPELVENNPLRAVIFPDIIGVKNPDLRINGLLWEVEGSSNSKNMNNLKHAIDEGSKQADYLIINLNHDVSPAFMFRIVKGRFKNHTNLRAVEFRYEGKYIAFYK